MQLAPHPNPPWRDYLLVMALGAIIFSAAHGPGLLDPWQANDDTRQQVFWMQSFGDPSLYPDDPLSRYASFYVPEAVQALYRLAAPFAPAMTFSKMLTGILFLLLSLCFFGLGAAIGGRGLGWCLATVTWLMPTFLYNMSGGISRSFAAPLTVLFLWRFVRRDFIGQALALLAQAIFIPYAFITCLAATCLAWVAGRLRGSVASSLPGAWLQASVSLFGVGLVWYMGHRFDSAGYGPLASIADMAGHLEFTDAGRLELYPQPGIFLDAVYYPFERIGLFLEGGLGLGIASLVALGLFLGRYARRAPWREVLARSWPVVWLLAGGFILYVAARLVLLELFVPDRYLSIPLNIVYALGLAVVVFQPFRAWPARRIAALLAVAAVLSCWRLHGQGLFDYSSHAQCYQAVRQLPPGVLLAGHPNLMDDVMTFGRRKALSTYKLAHVWSLGWWRWYEPRLRDNLAAYYAKDPGEVRAFAKKYGVEYMVVDEAHFTAAFLANRPFFAPYDTFIQGLAGKPGTFALLDGQVFPFQEMGPGLRLVDLR